MLLQIALPIIIIIINVIIKCTVYLNMYNTLITLSARLNSTICRVNKTEDVFFNLLDFYFYLFVMIMCLYVNVINIALFSEPQA